MEYIDHLSRGGQSKHSEKLSDYIAQNFSYLYATSPLTRQSNAPSRLAGEHVLKEFITRPDMTSFVTLTKIKCFSALLARCPMSSSIIKGKDWRLWEIKPLKKRRQWFSCSRQNSITHWRKIKDTKFPSNKHKIIYLLCKHRDVNFFLFCEWLLGYCSYLYVCNEAISLNNSFSTLSYTLSFST